MTGGYFMVTIEQVDKLREKANISYDEAKKILEETNGDILEAIIKLEQQNRISSPAGGGYYNSRQKVEEAPEQNNTRNNNGQNSGASFRELLGKLIRWLRKMISKGNSNYLQVTKGGEKTTTVSVTILVIGLVFAFWVIVPLLIVGLFFGYRYSFNGPDLGKESINQVMDSVANAAENIKNEVKGENSHGENSNS